MEPILKTVATAYSKRYKNLKNLCFVFPNKRCRIYLRKYFSELDIHTEDLPHILTITEFMSQLASRSEATKIEQLFTLFNAYLEISKEQGNDRAEEFEKFRSWGEIVLSDFNTVDLYLKNPKEIFKNVNDFRKITSNFLTEDQKEVIKEYFGIETFDDHGRFWKTFDGKESDLKNKFINLWQILGELHNKFEEELEERGLGNVGSIYRRANRRVEEKGRNAFPYKKIIVVGFNALTESERSLFKTLKTFPGYEGLDDFIDFIWDSSGLILRDNNFSASKFVELNKNHFPSPDWWEEIIRGEEKLHCPEINIISAPSNTAQVQIAGEILNEYLKEGDKKALRESEVALILPDESLLLNAIYALPEGLNNINLTMGVSMKSTSVATFISLLKRLYANLRENKKDGNRLFFVKDLKLLFSHPFSKIIFKPEEIDDLLSYCSAKHKINISEENIEEYLSDIKLMFNFPSKQDKEGKIFTYIYKVFDFLKEKLINSENDERNIEISQLEIYREYFQGLEETLKNYGIEAKPLTLLNLADRLFSSEKIGFEGEPLSGLQIMGTLETRVLDFKHVIILSMNEGIMPRKSFTSTFIPDSLRKDYGLPPTRYAEEIFGYYFYRLISRAERVDLVYDGRTVSGLKGGESRYLLQLEQYAPKSKVNKINWQFRMKNREITDSFIQKNEEIDKLLKLYSSDVDPKKNLSASSLNTYRECELKFALQNLFNISSDSTDEEYMDAITVGNILHEVMMDLYLPHTLRRKLLTSPVKKTEVELDTLLNNGEIIKGFINQKINKYYYGSDEVSTPPASGVINMLSEQIYELVREIIKHDKRLTPFNLYGCEISRNLRIEMKSGKTLNFKFAIDRLDEIDLEGEKRLRIVDYKTGIRKRKAENLAEVFQGGYQSEQIFQLFTYAWLLQKIGIKGSENVMTEIYFVPDLVAGKRGLPEIGKEMVTSYAEYQEEFKERFEEMVEKIFSSDSFSRCSDKSICKYCGFRNLCENL